ncbi:hypothetical protein L486_03147 [Kwoniella mangroviensis CBS 10435]|uniref:N-acetyltransferase domain-containing protein n=1 Tax=Kwoniella mangroviensis CBS 10435 TaxID=1331196 RepID=A0A1B9IT08_9TREE|nr:hypothetical protein L486_03147 [Kwoniella mangroviensis CBS 10435]
MSSNEFQISKTLGSSEGNRVLSILQTAGQDIPSHKYLFEGLPETVENAFFQMVLGPFTDRFLGSSAHSGSEFWTSKRNGEIQSIMAFMYPQNSKSYDHQAFQGERAQYMWSSLPDRKKSWMMSESAPKCSLLESTLGFPTEEAIEIKLLATDPEARRQGHAKALLTELKAESRNSRTPIWLIAHNQEAVQMYRALDFQETGSVDVDIEGRTATITAFTYNPATQ